MLKEGQLRKGASWREGKHWMCASAKVNTSEILAIAEEKIK
jgi:hypothetical protein